MLIEQSLYKAIKIFSNKQKLLARAIGEKPDKIRYWLNNNGRIPFHNAIAIEMATDGKVSRYDLAPYARFKPKLDLPLPPKLTINEKVSIGIAFEKLLGDRNGVRNNLKPRKKFYAIKGRTDALAAEHAGFGNHVSYRHAKKVITRGIYKLAEAIDTDIVSLSNAAVIAELPPDSQEEILQHSKKQIIAIVKQLKLQGEL